VIPHLLRLAASVATSPHSIDHRNHRLGAVGVRRDGIIVSARNGAQKVNNFYQSMPSIHAEVRCLRKMDMGGVIYVARVASEGLALARPCPTCQRILKGKKIKKVVYSISDLEYGTLYL